ncbi:hypothetical protein A2376_02930 [Candidatus Woesebacteria bacterium RIFOXYB1_FULL_47_31]|uniref:Uncharacterized protein n=4 Tax=Candidatus Woeseibacteriota TaxID=1752722 RepID=A0A0G1QWD9_9BACT|nr:MAG: hypothetical protein UX34_C0015G0002 [Candidatus Woesebacteria bacterium GW2011_GWF1_46_13]KKU49222.1 MAG: hypothetical protein UX67_C0003G0009 [Candidatus Woesebacteria bacterium GW2011_GWF2_46_8]OGM78420.1 MAG: hypothetical protein A2197_02925 [Candidatus Woesebacteria bacterium RIFOXYA1_FULL_48_16]OGM83407.1 MAG: hypothetical protein A2376_02930 [Candidatus Woesebacteria bacterium RIFOXYB1_FULL_47_31]
MTERITRREFVFKVVPLFLGGAALACSRANVPIPTPLGQTPAPFLPENPTETFDTIIKPTSTNTPEPSPTPTEVLRNPFGIGELDLSKEGELTLEVVLNGESRKVSFMIKPGELGQPGENAGATAEEGYFYVLLYLHSGYYGEEELEAEFLRNYIEGYNDRTITDDNYVLDKLDSLEGLVLTISQGNVQEKFEIYATAKIPHEAKPIFDLNNLSAADVVAQYAVGSPEKFEYFKDNPGILITFCGWGPESASRNPQSPDYRYTYSQYVLGLRPINHQKTRFN